MTEPDIKIEKGDRMKLGVHLVETIQNKLGGMSLEVEVVDIKEFGGFKELIVRTPPTEPS